MAKLVLGPLLRYVGETEAVVWVETDEPCEVEVLGHSEPTFCVAGHHYALVVVDGLEPGSTTEYEVALDGERRWPEPDSEFPPSVIRTLGGDGPLRVAFGSCRVSLPHHAPFTLPKEDHEDGREFDALYSLVKEMLRSEREKWPGALLMLGDQVYADEVSPETLAFIRKRRDTRKPPGEEVADFEEYTRLYRESWEDPEIRWLLSTVSVSMVIDDHDIHDDWNISKAWVEEMRELDWWAERERAGLAHLLGLPVHRQPLARAAARERAARRRPRRRRRLGVLQRGRRGRAPAARRRPLELLPRLRRHPADRARLALRADARRGPALDPRRSGMGVARGAPEGRLRPHPDRHLGSGRAGARRSTTPSAGARRSRPGPGGVAAPRVGEWMRRTADLDHWAAFGDSFERLLGLVARAAAGEFGTPPASIMMLSGDVHHAYLAELAFPRSGGAAQRCLAGGLLAVPQRARRSGAPDDRSSADSRRSGSASSGGSRGSPASRASGSAGASSRARSSTTRWRP